MLSRLELNFPSVPILGKGIKTDAFIYFILFLLVFCLFCFVFVCLNAHSQLLEFTYETLEYVGTRPRNVITCYILQHLRL